MNRREHLDRTLHVLENRTRDQAVHASLVDHVIDRHVSLDQAHAVVRVLGPGVVAPRVDADRPFGPAELGQQGRQPAVPAAQVEYDPPFEIQLQLALDHRDPAPRPSPSGSSGRAGRARRAWGARRTPRRVARRAPDRSAGLQPWLTRTRSSLRLPSCRPFQRQGRVQASAKLGPNGSAPPFPATSQRVRSRGFPLRPPGPAVERVRGADVERPLGAAARRRGRADPHGGLEARRTSAGARRATGPLGRVVLIEPKLAISPPGMGADVAGALGVPASR